MKHYEQEALAELCIDKLKYGKYSWAVCQPDAHWGEYHSGVESSYEDAVKVGQHWLTVIHRKQGY